VTFGPLILALLQGVVAMGPSTDTLASSSSSSPSAVIAVILPGAPTVSMIEALNRLRGEAASVGFELRFIEAVDNLDPIAQLDSVARGLAPAAVVALSKTNVEGPAESPIGSIDVRFLDRTTGKTSVGHLTVEAEAGDRADLVLAVRVVDFIRARMFDSLVRSLADDRLKRRPLSAPVRPPALVGRRYLAIGAGATGGVATYFPTIEVGYSAKRWLRLGLGAGGFGAQTMRENASTGNVTIDQRVAKASVTLLGRPWWRLCPAIDAGVSAFFWSVHGVGYSGFLGHNATDWSPGAFVSAGVGAVLAAHLVLQMSGGAVLLFREPSVLINEVEVAHTGRSVWLANAALGVTF
jgi:hypothetical protein